MKFSAQPICEHPEIPLADDATWERLVSHWQSQQSPSQTHPAHSNSCYVVTATRRGCAAHLKAQLAEIRSLVITQGDSVVGEQTCTLNQVRPHAYFGRGVAERIAEAARQCNANLLVVDAELSPSQTRNLEDITGLAVSDREAVILNVFAKHAGSRRARMQVELAQLQYLRPRIRGLGLNMDQQAGGIMGSRGAGETASELLARKLDGRLAALRRAHRRITQADKLRCKPREACQRVALVGYTNAGKTSLMNALANETLCVRDRPFETLETTSRCISRHGTPVLISDTVGFIRHLPERLLASFESTLREALAADVLIIVADISDPELELHLQTTCDVLAKLGASGQARLYALNKVDRIEHAPQAAHLRKLTQGHPHLCVSSPNKESIRQLREAIMALVRRQHQRQTVFVPEGAKRVWALLHSTCQVLHTRPARGGARCTLEGTAAAVARITRTLQEDQQ